LSTILLVSADGELRRLAAAELAKGGHHSLLSPDPIEAARLLTAGGVDAAIVDLELPEPGGEALLARLRADERGKDLPVLAVLRRGDRPGGAVDADHWLARPLGRSAMAEAVLKLVSARRAPVPAEAAGETAQLCSALRAPLAVIVAHIEAVGQRGRDLPPELQRRLQEMAQAAGRIAILIGLPPAKGGGRA